MKTSSNKNFHRPFQILKIIFLLTSLLVSATAAESDKKNKTEKNKNLLEAVQKLQKNSSFKCDFIQNQKNIALGIVKKSSGSLSIQKEEKKSILRFRFEVFSPEASILISDGKTTWYFIFPEAEGEKGLLTVRKKQKENDLVHSQPAIRILAGMADLYEEFQVQSLAERLFRLIPKAKNKSHFNDFQRIDLELEKQTNLVYKIILKNKLGNETELIFKGVQFGVKFPQNHFQFEAPNSAKSESIKYDTEYLD